MMYRSTSGDSFLTRSPLDDQEIKILVPSCYPYTYLLESHALPPRSPAQVSWNRDQPPTDAKFMGGDRIDFIKKNIVLSLPDRADRDPSHYQFSDKVCLSLFV